MIVHGPFHENQRPERYSGVSAVSEGVRQYIQPILKGTLIAPMSKALPRNGRPFLLHLHSVAFIFSPSSSLSEDEGNSVRKRCQPRKKRGSARSGGVVSVIEGSQSKSTGKEPMDCRRIYRLGGVYYRGVGEESSIVSPQDRNLGGNP